MSVIYLDISELITEKEFPVFVPAFYHPHLPEHLKNPKKVPLEQINRYKMVATRRPTFHEFQPLDDECQMQKAAYSIEVMIDMFQKKISFELCNDDDVVTVFEALDSYLNFLLPHIRVGVDSVIEYARKVVGFRAEMYKLYFSYMQRHPAAKESLYPNRSLTNNLVNLMMMSGGRNQSIDALDPLRSKANPPYDIDAEMPGGGQQETSRQVSIETSLGLSSEKNLADDGKDFNFDDFLRR